MLEHTYILWSGDDTLLVVLFWNLIFSLRAFVVVLFVVTLELLLSEDQS